MKVFCAVLLALIVGAAWHGGLPKTAPRSATIAWDKQPNAYAVAAIELAAATGQWQVKDYGVVTIATLKDVEMVGLPNGQWHRIK